MHCLNHYSLCLVTGSSHSTCNSVMEITDDLCLKMFTNSIFFVLLFDIIICLSKQIELFLQCIRND